MPGARDGVAVLALQTFCKRKSTRREVSPGAVRCQSVSPAPVLRPPGGMKSEATTAAASS